MSVFDRGKRFDRGNGFARRSLYAGEQAYFPWKEREVRAVSFDLTPGKVSVYAGKVSVYAGKASGKLRRL